MKARKLMFCIGAIASTQGVVSGCKSTGSGSSLNYAGSSPQSSGYEGVNNSVAGGYEGVNNSVAGGYEGVNNSVAGGYEGVNNSVAGGYEGVSNSVTEWIYKCVADKKNGYVWLYSGKIQSSEIPAGSLICTGWSRVSSYCSMVLSSDKTKPVPCDANHLQSVAYTW